MRHRQSGNVALAITTILSRQRNRYKVFRPRESMCVSRPDSAYFDVSIELSTRTHITESGRRGMRFVISLARSPSRVTAIRSVLRSLQRRPKRHRPLDHHLEASYRWLCAAHDANADGGVAGSYHLAAGWQPSYPETTGYIIPNMLAVYHHFGFSDAATRALRMADWEISVQLASGACQGGLIGASREPAVFDTGQVLFGWVSAFDATGDSRYAEALHRAANWLLKMQDDDGAWRRSLSQQTSNPVHAYNVRAAWGLGLAGVALREPKWIDAAAAKGQWVLTQQNESGWFSNSQFHPGEVPLLHTIVYTIEGLLELGRLTSSMSMIDGAHRALNGLLHRRRTDGGLRGRYQEDWRPVVPWRCPVGEAQTAVVLLREHLRGHDVAGPGEVDEILDDVCALQDLNPRYRGSYGGVPGSYPIWGPYVRYSYLNWGAKFLHDALLMKIHGIDPHGRFDYASVRRAIRP